MRFVYSLVISLISPFFFIRLLYRSRKASAYRTRWAERLAIYKSGATSGVLWFHAVSFGEAEAVFPLIKTLQAQYPDLPVLVTTTTLTGSNRVLSVLGDSVQHVYLPYDLPGTAGRFLRRYNPVLGVVVETEIWPNLYRECGTMKVPLAIINARLSERSARGYKKLRGLVSDTLKHVLLIAAQAPDDAQRFVDIGAESKIVSVTGNIKFDTPVPDGLVDTGLKLRQQLFGDRPVWIAASTHKGEEEQVLDAYQAVRPQHPELLLILVPRRPERFGRVALLCKRRGHSLILRSSGESCRNSDIFLLDSMGELKQFYATADLAFIGGSLVKTGGHNALEASALGIPALFGPHMFNFEKIAESLVKANAAVQVDNSSALAKIATKLLDDDRYRTSVGSAGKSFVQANRGALGKVVKLFRVYLDAAGK